MDEGEGGGPELREYARTIWRHRWLIIITVVIAVGAAVGLAKSQTPVYQATAQIIIQPTGVQQILSSSSQAFLDPARNVDNEMAVLQSKAVQDAVTKALGHTPTVSVSSSSSTSDVVSVSARSTNAQRSAADANGYAAAYVALRHKQNVDLLAQAGEEIQAKITEINKRIPKLTPGSPEATTAADQLAFLQQQLDQLQVSANLNQVGGAKILGTAEVPASPVTPKPRRDGEIAFVLGLLLGIGLAFLREYLDDTVTSREELERATAELPVLGQIPQVRGWRDRDAPHVVTREAPSSPAAEAYRTLRTSIQFLGVERPLNSLQVTSSSADDGKTTTLANLAVAFARMGIKVTIACCDLRQPRIHEFFGLSNEVGFTSVLLGQASLSDALQSVPLEANLTVLSAGPTPPNPSELLASARAREVISVLERNSDLVLIDSPPVLVVTDGLIVSGMADATLLVASAKSSSRRALRRSVQVLRQVDASLVGTVLNNADAAEGHGGGGGYGYGYTVPESAAKNGSRGSRRPRRKVKKVLES